MSTNSQWWLTSAPQVSWTAPVGGPWTDEVVLKIVDLASTLGVPVSDLVMLWNAESDLNPSVANPSRTAFGLAQLSPENLATQGLTGQQLIDLPLIKQIDVIGKIYGGFAKTTRDAIKAYGLPALYTANFLTGETGKAFPTGEGTSANLDYVLARRDFSDPRNNKYPAYLEQNSGLTSNKRSVMIDGVRRWEGTITPRDLIDHAITELFRTPTAAEVAGGKARAQLTTLKITHRANELTAPPPAPPWLLGPQPEPATRGPIPPPQAPLEPPPGPGWDPSNPYNPMGKVVREPSPADAPPANPAAPAPALRYLVSPPEGYPWIDPSLIRPEVPVNERPPPPSLSEPRWDESSRTWPSNTPDPSLGRTDAPPSPGMPPGGSGVDDTSARTPSAPIPGEPSGSSGSPGDASAIARLVAAVLPEPDPSTGTVPPWSAQPDAAPAQAPPNTFSPGPIPAPADVIPSPPVPTYSTPAPADTGTLSDAWGGRPDYIPGGANEIPIGERIDTQPQELRREPTPPITPEMNELWQGPSRGGGGAAAGAVFDASGSLGEGATDAASIVDAVFGGGSGQAVEGGVDLFGSLGSWLGGIVSGVSTEINPQSIGDFVASVVGTVVSGIGSFFGAIVDLVKSVVAPRSDAASSDTSGLIPFDASTPGTTGADDGGTLVFVNQLGLAINPYKQGPSDAFPSMGQGSARFGDVWAPGDGGTNLVGRWEDGQVVWMEGNAGPGAYGGGESGGAFSSDPRDAGMYVDPLADGGGYGAPLAFGDTGGGGGVDNEADYIHHGREVFPQ